jgi:hypothetical protein
LHTLVKEINSSDLRRDTRLYSWVFSVSSGEYFEIGYDVTFLILLYSFMRLFTRMSVWTRRDL